METLLILAAVAVAVLALAIVSALSSQGRRPPLRTRQEEELGDGDALGLIESLDRDFPRGPRAPSPIDREAPILDLEAIEAELARVRDDPPQQIADGAAEDRRRSRPATHSDTDMDRDPFDDPPDPQGREGGEGRARLQGPGGR